LDHAPEAKVEDSAAVGAAKRFSKIAWPSVSLMSGRKKSLRRYDLPIRIAASWPFFRTFRNHSLFRPD